MKIWLQQIIRYLILALIWMGNPPLGEFPMEIKTEIRYPIICCYLNFALWN